MYVLDDTIFKLLSIKYKFAKIVNVCKMSIIIALF